MLIFEVPHGYNKLSILLGFRGGGGAAVLGMNFYARTHLRGENTSYFLIMFIQKYRVILT
jgi:hypothetical protein